MRVALGLGSNLGDRARHLKRAVRLLVHGPDPLLADARLARVYRSPAVVPPGAPVHWDRPYLNTVIEGETRVDPDALLARIQALEKALGRERGERWAPRPLDVDVLWWDAPPSVRPALTVPHPRLLERSFALEPLRDLLPDLRLGEATVAEHARRRRSEEAVPAVRDREEERRVVHPLLMAILNVTPDSFSDGGLFDAPEAALRRARAMVEGGADILDVGAESTRPDGDPVLPGVERGRLEAVMDGLAELRRDTGRRLSLDSRHPEVVAWGLERGVDWINDVTGFRDAEMRRLARESEAELVAMHSLSVPVVRGEVLSSGEDPVELVSAWGRRRIEALASEGIDPRRLHLDPGIGFGKSPAQSWALLDGVERLHALGRPLVVGHSRKSFLTATTGLPPDALDEATVDISLELGRRGVEVVRVHDPGLHARRFLAELPGEAEPWTRVGPQSRSLTRPSSSE